MKEKLIMHFTSANAEEKRPVILVATQAVEVSLDIDLDTIYSEPAPLEALVQRFGRINRAQKKGISPVHVFDHPKDGHGIYNEELISRTLAVLMRENGNIIEEHKIGKWLDEIYAGEVERSWKEEFSKEANRFQEDIIDELRPFDSSLELKDQFAKMFDGIDVLPNDLYNEYLDFVENKDFLEAQKLLVSISWKRYLFLNGRHLIRRCDDTDQRLINVPYSEEFGLDFESIKD